MTYFTNLYPAVSHTFVRRELEALELMGYAVQRLSLRTAPGLTHPRDVFEAGQTTAMLRLAWPRMAIHMLSCFVRRPSACVRCWVFGLRLRARTGTGLLKMLAYLLEAMVLCELCRAHGSRLLRVHFGGNGAVIARLARRMGGPAYAVAYHGPEEFEEPGRWDIAGTVAESAFVTAISEHACEAVRRASPRAIWDKIHIVPCGVGEPFLRPEPLPGPGRRMLCVVARLTARKGLGLLIEAMADEVVSGADLGLEVIGDGELMEELISAVEKRGLGERVSFRGALGEERVRETMIASHGLVLPSLREGLPVVLMEAMGLGRPVIASRVDGVPELVEDGLHGWLVPPGDREALAGALRVFAHCDAGTLGAMGMEASRQVRERHDIACAARRLDGVIRASIGPACDAPAASGGGWIQSRAPAGGALNTGGPHDS
ncbi:MAG: glycosyltransferase family 4 protein [Phycisphaerales bacterium]|nr:glycosyltransferase family 4 protein [Planctomycetota bacterium]MCH8508493.1 glycosyltransferase family 4 protein [Phycisphaerales bacterium]